MAIDGTTLRRSFDRAALRSPLHVVTAFAAEARVVPGQIAAGTKESEITAARHLLGLRDLEDVLVTGDALHCRGETARLIRDKGGDWPFTLKDNRPSQRAEVDAWFAAPLKRPAGEHTTTDADHGGFEVRRHRVSHDVDRLLSDRRHPDEARMPGLAMIREVEATTTRDGRDGPSRTASVGCSTSASTRTAPGPAGTMPRRTSQPSENPPSTFSSVPGTTSPSAAGASAQDGPTTSPATSSDKCHSPDLPPPRA